MTALIVIGLIIGAFALGRLVQFVRDAGNSMGGHDHCHGGPR
jgi:hypothetical protein